MIIRLTESDLLKIIGRATDMILEAEWKYSNELIHRYPFISVDFTAHCIQREYQRVITEQQLVDSAVLAIKDIVRDRTEGILKPGDKFKIINKDSCVISVCVLKNPNPQTKISKLTFITAYIWDGRTNIDTGMRYYVGEESVDYLEARKWNEENQDKVLAYMDWKRSTDIARQMRKAENEYSKRGTSEMQPEYKARLINRTYDEFEKSNKKAIHDAMDPEDLDAVRAYHREMDRKPLSSKGSANRDLRAMDLWQRRKDGRDAEGNGLKVLGKIDLSKLDPNALKKKYPGIKKTK